MKIHIPNPCHEDWSAMQPEAQGRFCQSCAKTVVDFTAMSDEAVRNYLLNQSGQSTCGRFRSNQVEQATEQSIQIDKRWFEHLPYTRQLSYAIIFFFAIGFTSCRMGAANTGSPGNQDTAGITAMDTNIILGKPVNPSDSTSLPSPPPVHPSGNITGAPAPQDVTGLPEPPEPVIMGGISAPMPVPQPDTVSTPPAPPEDPPIIMGEAPSPQPRTIMGKPQQPPAAPAPEQH